MFRSGVRRQTLGLVHRVVLQYLLRCCSPWSLHVARLLAQCAREQRAKKESRARYGGEWVRSGICGERVRSAKSRHINLGRFAYS